MAGFVNSSAIIVEDRQRKDISPKELETLKRSILSKGLLHAPLISIQDDSGSPLHVLIAGERRLRAMKELHEEQHQFLYDGKPVPLNTIPYTTISDLSDDDLWEAELEENILRQPLTWLEEAEARAKIHRFRQKQNPQQLLIQTGAEIAARTGRAPETEKKRISHALLITDNKDHPKVKTAKNAAEAVAALLDEAETSFKATLIRQTASAKLPHTLLKGDCREQMKTLAKGSFNVIFSDPPYGISADSQKGDSKHFYDDSPENALDIAKFLISSGFDLCGPSGTLLLFCDIEHFLTLRDYSKQHGWSTWRTPLVWFKGQIGHAPWGRGGFVRSSELMLYAVKGGKELYASGGPDVLNFPSVTRGERTHAAEKPKALLHYLLSRICIPGDTVLDPCCGSGSIFPVANTLSLRATGIELDPTYFDLATTNLMETYSHGTKDDNKEARSIEEDLLE